LPRYKILLEYDGTDFFGWQLQAKERTVQGELEKALLEFGNGRIAVTGAGRTDAGVHALGQVAHFDLKKELESKKLTTALNAKTPSDILIKSCELTEPDFHARYDAIWRKYLYIVAKTPTAIGRKYCWFPQFDYDFKLLQQLPAEIVGENDFAAFCKAESLKESTICNVSYAAWTENSAQCVFEIVADRFLHQMVRLLVGTMLDVARGRFPADAMKEILDSREVNRCGMAAPPQGLKRMMNSD
jgi:tRNA pseudouridine38-40 synthase